MLRHVARAFALVAIACASSPGTNEPKRAEAPRSASAATGDDAPLVATASDPALLLGTPRGRARFAASPITELGEKIVAVVMAALDGRPLPTELPLGTPRQDTGTVELTGLELAEAKEIEWFGMGMEIDFSVATQGGAHANVASLYLLTEAGLHLVAVSTGDRKRKQALPDWARGLDTVARELLATARRGELATLLPDDDVRRVFAADEFWEKAVKTLPKAEELQEVEALARAATSGPTGFRMDDVELVGRRSNGKFHTAKLDFDEGDGSVVLEPHVHVRVVTLRNEEKL